MSLLLCVLLQYKMQHIKALHGPFCMVLLNGAKSIAWRLQLHVTKHCELKYEWGCWMGLAGVPSSDDIEAVHSQYAKTMMETMMQPHSNPNKLRNMFPDAPDDALDLMQKLLQFNPQKRLTAEEALQHPYVAHFHNPEDEPIAAGPITISVDDNKKVLFPLLLHLQVGYNYRTVMLSCKM